MSSTTEKGAGGPTETVKKSGVTPCQCKACGHVVRITLRPNVKCPKCGKTELVPIVAPGGAVDFELADRTRGPAVEDRRFGQIARWAGIVTVNQIARCMGVQREAAKARPPAPNIADVMLQENLLTQAQCLAILKIMAARPDSESERELGNLLIEAGHLKPEAVQDCLEAQKRMLDQDLQPPRFALLVIEKRLAADHQVMAALKIQKKNGKGLLVDIESAIAERAEEKEKPRLAFTWRSSPVTAILAALVTLAAIYSIYITVRGPRPKPVTIDTICEKCGYQSRQEIDFGSGEQTPLACEKCKARAVYSAVKCTKCGTVFPMKPPPPPPEIGGKEGPPMPPADFMMELPKCPKCGSWEIGPVTPPQMPGMEEGAEKGGG